MESHRLEPEWLGVDGPVRLTPPSTEEGSVFAAFARSDVEPARRTVAGLRQWNPGSAFPAAVVRGGPAGPDELRRRLLAQLDPKAHAEAGGAGWADIVAAASRPNAPVLVFDAADRIAECDSSFTTKVARAWRDARARGRPARIIFLSDDRRFLASLSGEESPFYDPVAELTDDVADPVTPAQIEPLSFAALARLCPTWSPLDVIRGYAVFGGVPSVLRELRPDRSLSWNVIHRLLTPTAPLFERVPRALAGQFQKVARYGEMLTSLAEGARTWQDVVRSTPGMGQGSQLGAYMKRLEERGWVAAERSLDASDTGRRRRYRIVDPADGFWLDAVAPIADRLRVGHLTPDDAWGQHVEPRVGEHAARAFRVVARQFVGRCAADILGSPARVVGGLWGDGYDFDVSATLRDGSVVYGHALWNDRSIGEGALIRAREQLRETRYGFGRERRSVLLCLKNAPRQDLVRAALRDANAHWVDAERIVELARSAGS